MSGNHNEPQRLSGNTNSESLARAKNSRDKAYRNWTMTLNNYTQDELIKLTTPKSCEFFFQKEIGEETGTPHLQGVFLYDNGRTMEQMKNWSPRAHWEVIHHYDECIKYVQKERTRAGEQYTNMDIVEDPLKGIKLYDWQQKLENKLLITCNERRIINWLWEPTGNSGKTTFCLHFDLLYNKPSYPVVYVLGTAADMKYAISTMKKKPKVVFLDNPRGGKIDAQGVEQIKNGYFFTGKYETGIVRMNPPHVVIFSNSPPTGEEFSEDRYNVIELNKKPNNYIRDISVYFQ